MPYIGYNVTNAGSFALIDDIASTFNGSNTAFTLQVGGVNITPNVQNLIISIDGVVQQVPDAYSVSGSTITFTEAPASGADFYGILMGNSSYVENNSIGADELSVSGDGSSGQLLASDGDGTFSWLSTTSITSVGTLTGLSVNGDIALLSANDKISDGTNNILERTAGGYITIGASAWNEIRLNTTGSTDFVLDNSGRVGIGEISPSERLHIGGDFADYRIYSRTGIENGTVAFNEYYTGSAWANDDSGIVSGAMRFSDSRDSLEFGVRAGGSTAGYSSTHMVIRSTGRVGIGTNDPSDQLTISNSGEASVAIIGSAGVGGGDATLYLVENNTNFGIRMRYDGGDDRLYINADEDTRNLMTIERDGSGVGFGTTSPSEKLHISSTGASTALQIHSGTGSATTGVSQIYFSSKDQYGGNTHQSYIKSTIDGTSSTSATKMTFHNRDSGGTVQEYLTINTGGNLIINNNEVGNAGLIRNSSFVSYADDASNSITSGEAGAFMLYAYDYGSGQGACFFCNFSDTVVKVAGHSNWTNSDSDGSFCVFKSASSHTVTVKNRIGSTKNLGVLLVGVNPRQTA